VRWLVSLLRWAEFFTLLRVVLSLQAICDFLLLTLMTDGGDW